MPVEPTASPPGSRPSAGRQPTTAGSSQRRTGGAAGHRGSRFALDVARSEKESRENAYGSPAGAAHAAHPAVTALRSLLAREEPQTTADLRELYDRFGPLLKATQVADYLGVRLRHLEGWRCQGGGPPYLKLGRARNAPIRYPVRQLLAWLEDSLRDDELDG